MPYLLPTDEETVIEFFNSSTAIHETFPELYAEQGLELLKMYPEGEMVVTLDEPFTSPDELRGKNIRTMTNPLHVGHCNRSGLFAALLGRENYTANAKNAFEHKQGFFEVFNGAGNYDVSKIVAAWGQPWDIIEPGIAIKQYPCCGGLHTLLDIMLDVNKRLATFKEGTDRNIEAQKIYGKGWQEVMPLIKLNGEVMEDSRRKAEALGLVRDLLATQMH